MNTKLVYRLGVYSLLGLTFLTACSRSSEKTTPSSDLPTLTNNVTTTDFTAMTAKSGRFSIPVPSNWVSGNDTNNDFSAYSPERDYAITANRYAKVDTPLGLEEFAHSLLKNSQETLNEEVELIQATIADKSGFLVSKEVSKEKQLLLFFYENNEEYRFVSIVTHPDNKSNVQQFLTQAVGGWVTIDENKQETLEFNQVITLPNTSLNVTLPTNWKQVPEDTSTDTAVFQDAHNSIRFTVRGLPTAGYTVDLNEVADQIAPKDSAPSKEAVTLGTQQGYHLHFNQTADTQSNYSIHIYVFHVNETIITFTASSKVSDDQFLRSTMETIITSMK